MIQRIQSVFIVAAAIVTLIFAFTTFASFEVNGSFYFMKVIGLYYQDTSEVLFETPNLSLSAVTVFSLLLSISALFNYKNRKLQLRLVSLNIFAQLVSIGLVFFATSSIPNALFEGTTPSINYLWPSFLPIVAAAALIMAMRGIKKDEHLIKSLDRIR